MGVVSHIRSYIGIVSYIRPRALSDHIRIRPHSFQFTILMALPFDCTQPSHWQLCCTIQYTAHSSWTSAKLWSFLSCCDHALQGSRSISIVFFFLVTFQQYWRSLAVRCYRSEPQVSWNCLRSRGRVSSEGNKCSFPPHSHTHPPTWYIKETRVCHFQNTKQRKVAVCFILFR